MTRRQTILGAAIVGLFIFSGVAVSLTDAKPIARADVLPVSSTNKPAPSVSDNSKLMATTTQGTTPSPEADSSNVIPNDTQQTDATCKTDMDEKQNSYQKDIADQKNALDSTLSFPGSFGSTISSQFVSEYNEKITAIFNTYRDAAASAHCTFPVTSPKLLPTTYPN